MQPLTRRALSWYAVPRRHRPPTTRSAGLDAVLDFVVQGNTLQLSDTAFLKELKSWMLFSASDAVERGDGLFARSSGNPALPSWLGERLLVQAVLV